MGILRVLCSKGDKSSEWNLAMVKAGDKEAIAAVREAERIFAEARSRGETAFKIIPGRPAERIDDFDPNVEEIIIAPRIAGG